jgi:hypothetical protein
MSASVWDTVELPATSHDVLAIQQPAADPSGPEHRQSDRKAMREVRRRERRRRRLYALSGVIVLAAFLAATVLVLDLVR